MYLGISFYLQLSVLTIKINTETENYLSYSLENTIIHDFKISFCALSPLILKYFLPIEKHTEEMCGQARKNVDKSSRHLAPPYCVRAS